eukprot:1507601-Ditylum_brightwellii.AAC.1
MPLRRWSKLMLVYIDVASVVNILTPSERTPSESPAKMRQLRGVIPRSSQLAAFGRMFVPII